jgi:hypothetical protein
MSDYNPKASLRTTRIIYYGLLGMPIAFILLVINMVGSVSEAKPNIEDPLQLALIGLFLAVIPASIIVPRQQLKKLKMDNGLRSKLAAFQTVFIIKSALWIGVANFGTVIFMMSENLFPLIVAAISVLIVGTYYPSLTNIQKHVDLDPQEVNQLL